MQKERPEHLNLTGMDPGDRDPVEGLGDRRVGGQEGLGDKVGGGVKTKTTQKRQYFLMEQTNLLVVFSTRLFFFSSFELKYTKVQSPTRTNS